MLPGAGTAGRSCGFSEAWEKEVSRRVCKVLLTTNTAHGSPNVCFRKQMVPRPRRHPYHHCGPFNKVLGSGSNAVDSACREHDISYGRIGPKAYFYNNRADRKFVSRMAKLKGFRPWLYGSVFRAKSLFAPSLPESEEPDMQTPPSSAKRKARARSRSTASRRSMSLSRSPVRRLRGRSRPMGRSALSRRRPRRGRSRGGNTKSRSSIRVPRRSWRKTAPRQRALSRYQNRGVIFTQESGVVNQNTTNSAQALVLGHGTWPVLTMQKVFWRTLVKAVFAKASIPLPNFHIAPPNGSQINDEVIVSYRTNPDTAQTTVSYTIVVTSSAEVIADFFATYFVAFDRNLIINQIAYSRAGSSVVDFVRLNNAKFRLNCKSAFKMQNQTTFPTETETDVVNNVPVTSKVYEGFGTGTRSNRDNSTGYNKFVINDISGIFSIPIPTTGLDSGLYEGPPPGYFSNTRRFSKMHLDAGQLKTSVLNYVRVFSMPKMIDALYGQSATSDDFLRYGNFRFFHFEHVLQAAAAYPAVVVHAEHNLRVSMSMSNSYSNRTDEIVRAPIYSTY